MTINIQHLTVVPNHFFLVSLNKTAQVALSVHQWHKKVYCSYSSSWWLNSTICLFEVYEYMIYILLMLIFIYINILIQFKTKVFFFVFFLFGFYGPFKNISLILSQSFIKGGQKLENPGKNHLTIRKQNLAFQRDPREARTTAVRNLMAKESSYPLGYGGPPKKNKKQQKNVVIAGQHCLSELRFASKKNFNINFLSVTLTSRSLVWVGMVKHKISDHYLTWTTSIQKFRRYTAF